MSVKNMLSDVLKQAWRVGDLKCQELLLDCDADNIGSGDVVLLHKVEKAVRVERVELEVVTPEGGTLTIDVGDYSDAGSTAVDADGFMDGVDGNATAGTSYDNKGWNLSQSAESPYGVTLTKWAYWSGRTLAGTVAAPKYIGALFNNAADAAKLRFRVWYREYTPVA